MKNRCDIVQDLLPLYCDKVLKPMTNQYVKDHLATCETCNLLYKSLISHSVENWNVQWKIPVQVSNHIAKEPEFIARLRKWRRRTSIVGIALILLVSALTWFIAETTQTNTPAISNKPVQEQKEETTKQ